MTPSNTFDVFNLETGKKYNFRVTARNQYGWGEPTITSDAIFIEDFVTFPQFEKGLPGQLKVLIGSSVVLECKVNVPYGNHFATYINFFNFTKFLSILGEKRNRNSSRVALRWRSFGKKRNANDHLRKRTMPFTNRQRPGKRLRSICLRGF